jgi:uncharacterized protein YecT (DUF1311 family)
LSILPADAALKRIGAMSSTSASRALLVTFCLILGLARAGAIDWPEGYIVDEDSVSPDGQYGIAIPESDDVAKEQPNPKVEEYYALNYFADVKNHKILGKIQGSDYFQHQNHAGLTVQWSEDSKIAIVEYEARYGFDSIAVVELKGNNFIQTDIGKRIQTAIDEVIKKQSHGYEESGYTSPLFRFEPGLKIRVYATALTNPKHVEKGYFALFQGLYDLPAKKWIKSAARPLTGDENDLLERASENCRFERFTVAPEAFQGMDPDAEEPQYQNSGDDWAFRSEESEFKYLDNEMNDVYKAARLILSPTDFEKVKIAQREWLKKRDAAGSVAEKSKLTAKRIDELQDASW